MQGRRNEAFPDSATEASGRGDPNSAIGSWADLMLDSPGLDDLDKEAIAILIDDGRIPVTKLARKLGLSITAARYRLDRLNDRGVVSVQGQMDPAFLGRPVHVWIQAFTHSDVSKVAQGMSALPQLDFVHWTENPQTGEAKVEAHGSFSEHDEVVDFVNTDVRSVPGVEHVETVIGLRVHAVRPRFWGEHPYDDETDWVRRAVPAEIDPTDMLIARHLRGDGRMSFADLARRTGLSAAAVRMRYLRLVDESVLQVRAMPAPLPLGFTGRGQISASLRGDPEYLIERLTRLPEALYVVETTGRAGIWLKAVTRNAEDLRALALREFGTDPCVDAYQVEIYTGVAKEFVPYPAPMPDRRTRRDDSRNETR